MWVLLFQFHVIISICLSKGDLISDHNVLGACRPGFVDLSASYNLLPGRHCLEDINECENPGDGRLFAGDAFAGL